MVGHPALVADVLDHLEDGVLGDGFACPVAVGEDIFLMPALRMDRLQDRDGLTRERDEMRAAIAEPPLPAGLFRRDHPGGPFEIDVAPLGKAHFGRPDGGQHQEPGRRHRDVRYPGLFPIRSQGSQEAGQLTSPHR